MYSELQLLSSLKMDANLNHRTSHIQDAEQMFRDHHQVSETAKKNNIFDTVVGRRMDPSGHIMIIRKSAMGYIPCCANDLIHWLVSLRRMRHRFEYRREHTFSLTTSTTILQVAIILLYPVSISMVVFFGKKNSDANYASGILIYYIYYIMYVNDQ